MGFPLQDRVQPPIDELYRIAKQYSRRREEVEDLVQDLLLEAVKTGKDFSDARFMSWGRGFLRNRAAFIARTEGRRRKREEMFHDNDQDFYRTCARLPEGFIAGLCRSLRIVARLVNCGLNRKEILYLLSIADTALRQRLTALRREWRTYLGTRGQGAEHPDEPVHTLSSGLIRRSLTQAFRNSAGREQPVTSRIIGSHDPDGHLFIISSLPAHKKDAPGNNGSDSPAKTRGHHV